MNRALLYTVTGVLLGFILILVPLVTVAEIRPAEPPTPYAFSQSLNELDRTVSYNNKPAYSSIDIDALAISFFVALAVYALFRRRTPRHDYRWAKPYPY